MRLRNPALAVVLRQVADQGAEIFYTGEIARAIAAKVRSHPTNPGLLTAADIAAYQPVERVPLCFDYRTSRICGFPPPSSGTIAVAQILGALEARDLAALAPTRLDAGHWRMSPEAVHLYAEAARLAFADRDAYVGDPAFVDVPVAGLIDPRLHQAARGTGRASDPWAGRCLVCHQGREWRAARRSTSSARRRPTSRWSIASAMRCR